MGGAALEDEDAVEGARAVEDEDASGW